jgi:hypothetical protein
MNTRRQGANQKRLIEQIKAKQQNTVWPSPLINSKAVDEFLWKGASDAPLVQRIGACIFGAAFISLGVFFVGLAVEQKTYVAVVFAGVFTWVGGRIFWNGLRNRKNT